MKMNFYRKISVDISKNNLFYFVYIPVISLFFIWGFMLVYYPEIAAKGVVQGIELCLDTVIPSLFPFMFFSSVLSESGILNIFARFCDKITRVLFALPGASFPIIIMSMIGGYPVGAFLIKKAFEKGELTASQGRRMLLFCVNPGPAFTISTVGSMMLGSKKTGIIIYISTVLTSLVLGILARFAATEDISKSDLKGFEQNNIHSIISSAAGSSLNAIVNICIWIVVFSCLNGLAECLPLNQSFFMFFKSFSEVTNGVITAIDNYPLPFISGIVAFAGICVHLQLLPCIISLKLKYKYFLTMRIVAASISTVISYFLYKVFPVSISTVSLGAKPADISLGASVPVCACLMLMSGLFIIGDNYTVKRKRVTETDNKP